MSSTMTTTLGTSNVRTSLRQTRTNPSRTTKAVGSSLRQSSLVSNLPTAPPRAQEHGFYPAITYFTDAITALPREFRRHTSLLKEVDAKAWAPEAHLKNLLAACITSKPPPNQASESQVTLDYMAAVSEPNIGASSTDQNAIPAVDNASGASARSHHDLQSFEHRKIFYHLRGTLAEMMVSMDEKNHLINSANEDLSRHLKRLTSVYPHVADEISEEARLGSLTHWAYIENKPPARNNAANSRREAAAGLAAMHDTDIASRSESRREAMLARKQRQNQNDSDFDDPRPAKRANVNGKSRRVGEITAESAPGLGISGAVPAAKRKRAEKPAGVTAMERSVSGALGGRALSREPSQQEGTKKRRALASATTAARKRINTANSATNSPKLVSSPLIGSFGKDAHRNSPMPGNVRPQTARARQNSTQARPPSSASNRNNVNGIRPQAGTPDLHKESAMTGKSANEMRSTMNELINNKEELLTEQGPDALVNGTNGMKGGIILERVVSKGGANSLKREEASAPEGNPSSETTSAVSARVAPPVAQNTDVKPTTTSSRPEREREQRPSRARSSKNATPIVNTLAESEATTRENHKTDTKFKRPPSSSSRSARSKDQLHDSLSPAGLPLKRSHKKGAGLAAQAAVLQAKRARQSSNKADTPTPNPSNENNPNQKHNLNSNFHSVQSPTPTTTNLSSSGAGAGVVDVGDEQIEEVEEEENLTSSGEEPRYCYCQQVSYGEMVACDAEDCPREWFHLECVGLGRAPGRNARWFCEECTGKERSKVVTGVGVGVGMGNGEGVGTSNANGSGNGNGNGNGNGHGTGTGNGNGQILAGRRVR